MIIYHNLENVEQFDNHSRTIYIRYYLYNFPHNHLYLHKSLYDPTFHCHYYPVLQNSLNLLALQTKHGFLIYSRFHTILRGGGH